MVFALRVDILIGVATLTGVFALGVRALGLIAYVEIFALGVAILIGLATLLGVFVCGVAALCLAILPNRDQWK